MYAMITDIVTERKESHRSENKSVKIILTLPSASGRRMKRGGGVGVGEHLEYTYPNSGTKPFQLQKQGWRQGYHSTIRPPASLQADNHVQNRFSPMTHTLPKSSSSLLRCLVVRVFFSVFVFPRSLSSLSQTRPSSELRGPKFNQGSQNAPPLYPRDADQLSSGRTYKMCVWVTGLASTLRVCHAGALRNDTRFSAIVVALSRTLGAV